jgi:hypothetical protein
MEIRYRLTVDDVVALQRHIFDTSPEMRQRVARSRIVLVIVGAGAGLVASLFTKSFVPVAVGAVVGIVYGLFSGKLAQRRMESSVRGAFDQDEVGNLSEERVIRLTTEGIEETTESERRFTRFRDIAQVDSTEIHTLIVSETGQSYMIPHGSVTEGDIVTFREAVKLAARKSGRQSGPPEG